MAAHVIFTSIICKITYSNLVKYLELILNSVDHISNIFSQMFLDLPISE